MSVRVDKSFEWTQEIEEIERAGLLRSMPVTDGSPDREVWVNGRRALNFSGNNYLGLAGDSQIIQAMVHAATVYGAGSTGSRLISGNTGAHRELEKYISSWKGAQNAVVFGSGYQANVGIITALTDQRDLIISDELNHASIIDGCRLSRAKTMVYPHLDVEAAGRILKTSGFRRKLLITESVFSMDGDFAPLKELHELCQLHGACMMVDEAHASGVKGPSGQGLAAESGVCPEIQMGTLGKALGVAGAYAAGTEPLIKLIINKARSFIYTTAQPPAVANAALEAIRIVASDRGRELRQRLNVNIALLHSMIAPLLKDHQQPSHIVPIHVGDSNQTMRLSRACLDRGIFLQGIRYPSVPEGAARLRMTLMSSHTMEDIEKVANILLEELKQH
jgi:8-amino-7-oxononanoate synthase